MAPPPGPRDARPWTDHDRLTAVLARWRAAWAGRPLYAVTGGDGWVRLHLEGDEHAGILLADLPGARLVAACRGRLPAPLAAALPSRVNHPLRALLQDARLDGVGMLPDDRVAAFRLVRPAGPAYLLHRMFGARGDTVLLDAEARVLWARHKPPHPVLALVPPDAAWTAGERADDDDVSAPALDHLARVAADRELAAVTAALERRLRAAARLADNLSADLARAERGDELRRTAETLAAHLHEVTAGQDRLETVDPRTGEPVIIPLDPARPPAANLEAAFRRARKAEKGRDVIAERLEAAEHEAAVLRRALAGAADVPAAPPLERLAAVAAWRERSAGLLPAVPVGRGRAPDEPARPFRRYRIDGCWEVWVGRSNVENDELTHRASHGKDLWLHAQGVPGSHVVLRTGGRPEQVPKAVIAKAAALAALHSKARHSALVPVVWTERRHVRKPRKAAPGTAVCQREQTVFAAPGVPRGVEPG